MSKKQNSADQQKSNKQNTKRKARIAVSFTVIAIALVVIFMPKKMENNTSESIDSLKFKKQGGLTLADSKGKPIVSIDIEIADNDAKREVGMMGRSEMEDRQGMLFVFQEEFIASFWMRNCILSLDMIFADKQGRIVTIHKNTKPFSDDNYYCYCINIICS